MSERAIVVIDLVESVRLMQLDEGGVIERWRAFVADMRAALEGGRMVKSLGDGLLLEYPDATAAAHAALKAHELIGRRNAGALRDAHLQLRAGCHHARLVIDELDVFGSGVNLAARLASLARPGDTVVSEQFRALLAADDGLATEDLGTHYLKHIEAPVRAFRLRHETDPRATPLAGVGTGSSLATLAVLPFVTASAPDAWRCAGDLLAEDLIASLSRSPAWRVTSRLSSARLHAGRTTPQAAARLLRVRYVVGGSVRVDGDRARVYAELLDARDGHVHWADTMHGPTTGLLDPRGDLQAALTRSISRALIAHELGLASGRPPTALHARTLLLQAVAGMHRMSIDESRRAAEALEHVLTRHPRDATGHAWKAKWHLIQLAQAWSENPAADAAGWRQATRSALDAEPEHALALALKGHAHAYLERDLDAAESALRHAVQAGPNEALAWLFLSAVHAFEGRGSDAVEAIARAESMSPLDPMSYFFDGFAAVACTSAGRHVDALAYARRSVHANAQHLASWVSLAIAAAHAGEGDEARSAGRRILELRPEASVARFVASHPARDRAVAERDGAALREAGLPN